LQERLHFISPTLSLRSPNSVIIFTRSISQRSVKLFA